MHVAAHESFHREGHDIHCRLMLTFSQAALGAKIQVPLLDKDKTKTISVPAGTQTNENYRIPGAGIPQLRGHGRGDQIIHFICDLKGPFFWIILKVFYLLSSESRVLLNISSILE